MPEIRTLSAFQGALDEDMGWRVKEIAAFRIASKQNGVERKFFIRAGIALIYAHWEGFIKASSEYYLNFVENRDLTYAELKSCFAVFGLKHRLQLLGESRQSASNIAAFDFILASLSEPAKMKISSAINTEANLTSKVFANIARSLDIDLAMYATKFKLIDESLVKRRNSIAHGEYLEVDGREFGELVDDILQLMRNYKTDLENAASLEGYKRALAAPV